MKQCNIFDNNSKTEDTKERILQETSKLFFQRGVKSVTMDDVAAQLGMSKRTIYEHFSDKESLLIAALEWQMERSRKKMIDILTQAKNIIDVAMYFSEVEDEHEMQLGIDLTEDIRKYHPKVYESIVVENERETREFIAEIIKIGIRQGYFYDYINIKIVSTLLQKEIGFIIDPKNPLRKNFSLKEIYEACFVTFIRGLCTMKGAREMDKRYEKLKGKNNKKKTPNKK